jgi:hypothetical protein
MSASAPPPTGFDHERMVSWKIVPTRYVALIANCSCKGVTWTGCSKGHILRGMQKVEGVYGYTRDLARFGDLMDKAAAAMRKVRAFESETMGQIFK